MHLTHHEVATEPQDQVLDEESLLTLPHKFDEINEVSVGPLSPYGFTVFVSPPSLGGLNDLT